MKSSKKLTHVDTHGQTSMVDVGTKPDSHRQAVARGTIRMNEIAFRAIRKNKVKKGDVLAVARIAGIQAAKRTHELIPLCHVLLLSSVDIDFQFEVARRAIVIKSTCRLTGKTGVEMEALTAVAVAALTIYDMAKALDKSMTIEQVYLLSKDGGKSGAFRRTKKRS